MANIGVTIDGISYSAYAESLERETHLCMPSHVFHLRLAANAPTASLLPWKSITIIEKGVTVLTGYLQRIEFNHPSTHIMVHGNDTYKRATDWFISEPLLSTGENVGYWAGYLCNLCGLSYSISAAASSGSTRTVLADLPLGLRYVSESLLAICQFSQWCMRVKPDGTLEFRSTARSTAHDYNLTTTQMELEEDTSDESTRNAVKVFGTSGSSGGGLVYSASRTVPRITDTRIMVFGDPNLNAVNGRLLGEAALDQFADLERRGNIKIVGNPNILVGQTADYFASSGSSAVSHFNLITDLRSNISTHSYEQVLTLGRRCYRLPSWGVTGVYNGPPSSGSTLLNGILAYWKFDESSGSRANSIAPNESSYRLTESGFGDAGPKSLAGKISNAAYFESPNFPTAGFRYFEGPIDDVFWFYNTTKTIAVWVRLDDNSEDKYVFQRMQRNGVGDYITEWAIFYQKSSDRFVFRYNGDLKADALGSPVVGQWYFIICTREMGVGKTIRINQAYSNSSVFTGTGTNNTPSRFQLGAFFDTFTLTEHNFWVGLIDEAGIWVRVLNETEQTDLYNSGNGRTWPFV